MEKPKILVVEDADLHQRFFQRVLASKVVYLEAQTVTEAERLFRKNPDVDLIALDACVPGNEINTLELLKKIRRTFNGPVIAISGIDYFRTKLVAAGCNTGCEKELLPRVIQETLGI